MLERLDAAVTAALQPLKAATDGGAAEDVVQSLAQVRIQWVFIVDQITTVCSGVLTAMDGLLVTTALLTWNGILKYWCFKVQKAIRREQDLKF